MSGYFRDPGFFKLRYWLADPFAHLRPSDPATEPVGLRHIDVALRTSTSTRAMARALLLPPVRA